MFQFDMILESRRNFEIRAMVDRLYRRYVGTVEEALTGRGRGHHWAGLAGHFRSFGWPDVQFVTITINQESSWL